MDQSGESPAHSELLAENGGDLNKKGKKSMSTALVNWVESGNK